MTEDPALLLPKVYGELRALAASYFRGRGEEAAEALGVSLRTVQKERRKAKAWLLVELEHEV